MAPPFSLSSRACVTRQSLCTAGACLATANQIGHRFFMGLCPAKMCYSPQSIKASLYVTSPIKQVGASNQLSSLRVMTVNRMNSNFTSIECTQRTFFTRTTLKAAAADDHHCHHSHGSGAHGHSHGVTSFESNLAASSLKQCQLVTAVGLFTNFFFSITKLWAGSAGGSVALTADGFHALSDIIADIISYACVSFSRVKLPRCRFPFGVGRLETCGTVLVAFVLLLGGVTLLWQSTVSSYREISRLLRHAPKPTAHIADHHGHSHSSGHSHFTLTEEDTSGASRVLWSMVILAASSVVCKELLFRWTRRVGKRAGSRVVVANAYHHRADAWSGAVALVGVGAQYLGIPGVDGLAGVVVSLCICKIGHSLSRDAVLEFFDYQRLEEVREVRRRLQRYHVKPLLTAEQIKRMENSMDGDASGSVNTRGQSEKAKMVALQESLFSVAERVRFINIFLVRHGHSYAAHATLIACESLHASEISTAVEQLSKLASTQLSAAESPMRVQETFISLLPCQKESTVSRTAYQSSLLHEVVHGDAHGSDPSLTCIAAVDTSDVVNPSLERCIQAITQFHHFSLPIRYNWGTRVVYLPRCGEEHHHLFSLSYVAVKPGNEGGNEAVHTPKEKVNDCLRDAESVAELFGCTVEYIH